MNKGYVNYWIGITLLITVTSFFFYKSILSDLPINRPLSTIEEIQDLQVQLHRDLLRYRSNQIQQYDTLNKTLDDLNRNVFNLSASSVAKEEVGIDVINSIEKAIRHQALLVEDFKTHHSILQNSLLYIFNISTHIHSVKSQSEQQHLTTTELVTLLLKYNEQPNNNIANKMYPLVDILNHNPDTDTKALINHSLMVIEKLPEIDEILERFNSLNTEKQIILLKNTIIKLRDKQNNDAQIFNTLLFLCTVYLIFYILYIFITLRKNQDQLSASNTKLNDEISLRTKTEKALYQLVDIDKNRSKDNNDDRLISLLNALCTALDVEYAYISKINSSGSSAEIIGMLDHGMFSSNVSYQLINTPCDEVIKNGRLVHNRDLANYFQDYSEQFLKNAVSYIGVRLTDKKENVIGVIAVACNTPIEDTNLAENILTIATSRASIELEYQIEINDNNRYQQGLTLIDNWIARLITEGYEKNAFYKNICRAAQEITRTPLAVFPVISEDKTSYHFLAACGSESEKLENAIHEIEDDDLCSWAILNNKSLLINDVSSDSRTRKNLPQQLGIKSALITPVALKDKPYGAIVVFRADDDFDKVDEQLMAQFCQSVQMAIINMQLVSDMRSERERAEVTLHSIGDAVITTNVNGKIEYMNHVAESLTAWSLADAKNMAVQKVFRIEDLDTGEPIHDLVKSCLYDGTSINKSIVNLVSKSGKNRDIESSLSPILNTSGNAEGVVIVFHDESQRRQLENTIRHQAAHDPLTNLLNRDAFFQELSEHVYDARNNDKHHVLFCFNLDRFKLINDTAGHSAGDQCLIQVTSLIQSCIRSYDVLARLGGDEFALILKHCTQKGALKIANTITKVIAEMTFEWDDYDYKLGSCIGINPLDKKTKDATSAIRKAELACYTAKDHGENHIYFYVEGDSELIKRQEETFWAARITDAIENNRLRLYAQPIVALKNRDPLKQHLEILVRLLDEDNQLIPPSAFIPAAERYNLINPIVRTVIFETFSFIHKYSDKDEKITYYSINLSGCTINDKGITAYIKETAEQFEVNPKYICFELTESAVIKNLHKAKTLVKDLKKYGFKFALDDFGSSLSSFQYLKNLSIDYLKIDGSFVSDMVNNNIDHATVAAINEASHSLGIETIAEYVENDQIMKKLQKLNVDYAQGYGIEQPKPLKETLSSADDNNSPSLKVADHKP